MAESILITGANRGIGLALTRTFAETGWQVLASCREPDAAVDLQQLAQNFAVIRILPLEVTDPEQIHELAETLHGTPIDILFNNAGIFGAPDQDFGAQDEAWWLETFRVNVIAPMKIIEALVDNVAASRHRVIATMGSLLGCLSENRSGGMHMYRSSKAAVHMLMRGLASDLRERGIIAVALHPGWVRTRFCGPQAPLEPFESAEGIARVLLGLKSESSGKLLTFEGKELAW
jgi:NAD(P)-dependent dehydrogenase (short-subunit alcohol dehydrogenase family)